MKSVLQAVVQNGSCWLETAGLRKVLPGHPGQVDFTARQETLKRM